MKKLTNDDKKLVQVAIEGWRQFFYYFWRFKWKTAWLALQASKMQIKVMQEGI